tara:strand:+ start:1115 stop:1771 length:657 start_codon:yes stop_codon:yes gene_type:complete
MLLDISEDILINHIINKISFSDLLSITLTSKKLYSICDKPDIWDNLYIEYYFNNIYRKERNKIIDFLAQKVKNTNIIHQFKPKDKYSRCILSIDNNHKTDFDIYQVDLNEVINYYIIRPGEHFELETYLYTNWMILPIRDWYNIGGFFNQGLTFVITINNIRLIDRSRFGNNWAHRLYSINLEPNPTSIEIFSDGKIHQRKKESCRWSNKLEDEPLKE